MSKEVQLKRITNGGLWAKSSAGGPFFAKKSYFNTIGLHLKRAKGHLK